MHSVLAKQSRSRGSDADRTCLLNPEAVAHMTNPRGFSTCRHMSRLWPDTLARHFGPTLSPDPPLILDQSSTGYRPARSPSGCTFRQSFCASAKDCAPATAQAPATRFPAPPAFAVHPNMFPTLECGDPYGTGTHQRLTRSSRDMQKRRPFIRRSRKAGTAPHHAPTHATMSGCSASNLPRSPITTRHSPAPNRTASHVSRWFVAFANTTSRTRFHASPQARYRPLSSLSAPFQP